MSDVLPYRIAVLCYLFDEQGRILLLHRGKPPNQHLYSPVGGKLERDIGESPAACAVREIQEEVGLTVTAADLHLTGIASETAFAGQTHWLMFLYELIQPVTVQPGLIREGRLAWHNREDLDHLPIPDTDRQVLWPLFWRYRRQFFCVHIDCRGDELIWQIEQPAADVVQQGKAPQSQPSSV